jgi:TorA maturation chaperone TorD
MNKTETEYSIAELKSRQGLYRLFNRMLSKEIDQQFLGELREPDLGAAINQLGLYLDEWPKPDNKILDQLAIEFTRLFLGPGKHISPHESVQIAQDGSLNNGTTASVGQFIEVAGFKFTADSKKYPDHICSEFEFMEALLSKQIEAIENTDMEEAETSKMLQEEFLHRHLIRWIPQFCAQIEQSSTLTFYKALGSTLSKFVQIEYENLVDKGGQNRKLCAL